MRDRGDLGKMLHIIRTHTTTQRVYKYSHSLYLNENQSLDRSYGPTHLKFLLRGIQSSLSVQQPIPPLRLSLDFQEPLGSDERGRIRTHSRPAGFKVLNLREGRYILCLDSIPHAAHSRRPRASLWHPNLEVLGDATGSILIPRDALPSRLGRRRELEAVTCARRRILHPDLDDPWLARLRQLVRDEQVVGRRRRCEAVPETVARFGLTAQLFLCEGVALMQILTALPRW